MATVAKITLDAETFRALASTTRLTVLKALGERRKTLTELARDLQLNKATVHEHMQLLTAAGLVRKRDDEGRKWIYYELTWTGQRILHPEATTTFNLLLGLSVAAAGGGVMMLGRALGWWFEAHHPAPLSEDYGNTAGAPQDQALSASGESPQPAAASSTQTQTASSTGTSTAASSGSGASSAPEAGQGAAASTTDTQAAKGAAPLAPGHEAVGHHSYFFDDGGWIALALLATTILFIVLATAVRRKLKPKPFNAQAAAAAEGQAPGSPPGP
jgi:DNA-binding transcriptional ArsR family regulator